MKDCIDIFSKLLIATITFLVPIIINLLTLFTAGEKRRIELKKCSEAEIAKKAALELQVNPNGNDFRATIDQTFKDFNQNDKVTQAELNKLNPILQFWYIFSFLSLSMLCLVIYFLKKSSKWQISNFMNPTAMLLASGIFYTIGLFFIIRILYTIIKTKRIIEQN